MANEFSSITKGAEISVPAVEQPSFSKIEPVSDISLKEANDFWGNFFGETALHTESCTEQNFQTTYKERYDITPVASGEWTGQRGESTFRPTDSNVQQELGHFHVNGIEYHNCCPDFSPVSLTSVTIENMTADRFTNFKQADTACANQWDEICKDGRSNWTARDVQQYRFENHLTWHEHEDTKTCQLIPRNIHEACRHSGGVAECQRQVGGIFDD